MGNVLAENVTIKLRVDDAEVRAQLARARAESGAPGAAVGRAVVAPGGLAMTVPGGPASRAGAPQAAATAQVAYEAGRGMTQRARQARIQPEINPTTAAADMAAAWAAMPGRTSTGRPRVAPMQRGVEGLSNAEVAAAIAGGGLDPGTGRLTNAAIAEAYVNRRYRVEGGDIPVPQYFETKPQVPTRLQQMSLLANSPFADPAASRGSALAWRATKRALASTGAGFSLAGALAFSREVSQQRNDYFREILSNPNSTVKYKPYSNAAAKAAEAFASFGMQTMYALTRDLPAAILEGLIAPFASDDFERKFGGALSILDSEARHQLGMTEKEWKASADKGVEQMRQFNKLREQALAQARNAAADMAARAEKLGFGARSREAIQSVLMADPKFRNEFLKDKAREFFKDNPIGANGRQVDPWGVMK